VKSFAIVALIVTFSVFVGCDDSSSNQSSKPPAKSKTNAEKANILLKHMSGKDETVIDKMNVALEDHNAEAMRQMLPENTRQAIEDYTARAKRQIGQYESGLEQAKAAAAKLNTDDLKKLVSDFSAKLGTVKEKYAELLKVSSSGGFDILKADMDKLFAQLADLQNQVSKFDSGKALDGVKSLLGR